MAENEGKKEDQFGFDAAGEALGYISLEQARLVAMQAARENPGNYGPQLAGSRMVFQLVEQEEGEDYYIVTLSFRPEGDFTGSPGQEQFFIEKEGPVADRQVLSLPTGGRRRRSPVIPVVIGAVVLAVVVVAGVVFAAGGLGGGGDAEGPVEALVPTNTPAAIAAQVPPVVDGPTDTPTPSPIQTATSAPPIPATAALLPIATTVPAAAPVAMPTVTSIPATTVTPTPVPAAAQPIQFQFIRKWGSQGTGDGQFQQPDVIAVDEAGDVYVADRGNHRVQKFGADGRHLLTWGSEGAGDGQFIYPRGVALDGVGNVYVVDQAAPGEFGTGIRIQKFSSDGRFLLSWGTSGDGDGQFYNAEGIAVDGAGNVYVTDYGRERVQKFTSEGGFLLYLGTQGTGAGRGTGDGQFYNPKGISVGPAGNVFVAETINHRVQVFDSNGRFLRKWGSEGSGDGQFKRPGGIAIDQAGNVYVADRENHRVQVFDSTGRFLLKWGSEGSGNGQFDRPWGIAVDGAWNVYVSDRGNHRIQVFAPVRPSPSAPVPIPTPLPTPTPIPGAFEALSTVEKELVGLWSQRQAATTTSKCRTRFVPTGTKTECSSESKNDGIWFYLRFNADGTGCGWEEPDERSGREKQSSFSNWEIAPPEHPELKLFRVEAVPRGFEYNPSTRRLWPIDFPGLIYAPSTTPKSCPD